MDIKSQTVTILTTNHQVMVIIILWYTTVLLVVMMDMYMHTLACRTTATHMHTTHIQVLIITTITMQQPILTLMLLHITQVALAE